MYIWERYMVKQTIFYKLSLYIALYIVPNKRSHESGDCSQETSFEHLNQQESGKTPMEIMDLEDKSKSVQTN